MMCVMKKWLWLGFASLCFCWTGAWAQTRVAPPPSGELSRPYAQPSGTVRSASPYNTPYNNTQATYPSYYGAPPASSSARPYSTPVYEEEEEEDEGIYWFWGSKWPGMGLTAKIGTTGLGADLTFGIIKYLNFRGGFNYGSFSFSHSFGDVDYDLDVTMVTFPLMMDIYPLGNNFRISGGLYFNADSSADLDATPDKNVQIGHHTYTPEVVGTLTGKIKVDDTIAPYVGIGYGNPVGEDQKWTFFADLGVIFHSYSVELTSNGAGMDTPVDTFRKDLELEQQNIQDDLDSWKFYPVLTLGISYHF